MGAKARSFVFVALAFLTFLLLSATAYADDPTVGIPACLRAGGVTVPAGSPVTLVGGWTMSTRGNTQSFANAATGVITVDGVAVPAAESAVFQPRPDVPPDGNADDAWRVQWSSTTTAPAQAGQTLVATFSITLSRQVADHELGSGQPGFLGPGVVVPLLTCTITAS